MTMLMTTRDDVREEHCAPVAYVSLQHRETCGEIVFELERRGWAVVTQPTGFHLLQEIAGVIESYDTGRRPSVIVIDAHSRGCSGVTIAAGLRELGITIPIVLVAAPGETLPLSPDDTLHIVDRASAKATVNAIAAQPHGRRPRQLD